MESWFSFYFLPLAPLITLWGALSLFVSRRVTYKHAAQIRRLLNPRQSPLEDLLHARAMPNQRLVNAFGITSTFVSGDPKIHKTFTTSAKALIATPGDKDHTWRAFALSAEAIAHQFLPTRRNVVDFSTVIQCVTFSVVLSSLFHTDPDTLCHGDVVHATSIINQRWKDSKIKRATAMRKDQSSLRILLGYIEGWIIDRDRYPNPLDFILPAYETLWRVVAVTVAYVYCCRDNTLQDVIVAFGKDPTEERFAAFGDDGLQPSMQAIILEVLRLHPPTRHIVRASGYTEPAKESWWRRMLVMPGIEVADVEAVHLSNDYGENTSTFDPMRFHPSRMGERIELFSFGYGRLRCVAAAWAPMAAAVIAATIVAEISETGCRVKTGPRIGRRSGWDGWAVGKEDE